MNSIECFCHRDLNGEVFTTNGRGAWFSITYLYDTTTHMDSYHQVKSHNLASIKFFDKNPDDATISIVFNKFITTLCDYKYAGQTPEAIN